MHRYSAGIKSFHSTLIARQNEDKRNDAHRMPLNEYMREGFRGQSDLLIFLLIKGLLKERISLYKE